MIADPGGGARPVLIWLCLVAPGLLGCLRAFGPELRTRGAHAGVRPGDTRDACMGCHESESEALARIADQGTDAAPADAPLVADWMVVEARECTGCHGLRRAHAR